MTMPVKIVEIADAVTAELAKGSFSQAFTAERVYQPTYDLKDMVDLHVTIVPKSRLMAIAGRNADRVDYAVDIGIQKKISNDGDIDGMMALVAEIAGFLNRRPLSNLIGSPVAWVAAVNEPVFVPEHIEQLRQFTSVLTITYREIE